MFHDHRSCLTYTNVSNSGDLRLNTSSAFNKGLLKKAHFQTLFDVLHRCGYKVVGPVVKDGAILYQPVTTYSQLAYEVIDEQQPGGYTLSAGSGGRYFEWNTGPQALKPLLFKPQQTLWTCHSDDGELSFKQASPQAEPLAVLGVRACDLSALALQDQHFLNGPYADVFYKAQREQLLLVAVNCSRSNEQCFCASTGDGPEASFYYDLLLDELDEDFLVCAGSDKGQGIVKQLNLCPATREQNQAARQQIEQATGQQHRRMPGKTQLNELPHRLNGDVWKSIADRCLACGNCTLVCPTCFCSKQESESDLFEPESEQIRRWDSCFSEEYGHIFGKNVRPEISDRYRQWFLHKLVFWHQQYGRSGCVGCGRCTTWCPVGIDLVEEALAMVSRLNPDKNPQSSP